MPHEAAIELLEGAAFETLSPSDRERVLAHAETCSECGPILATFRDVVALMAYGAPAAAPAAGKRAAMRARLMARAAADHATDHAGVGEASSAVAGNMPTILPIPLARGPHTPPAQATPAVGLAQSGVVRWANTNWLAIAASVAFVISTGALVVVAHDRTEVQGSYASVSKWAAELTVRLDSANAALAASTKLVGALSGARVKVVELAAAGPNTPSARMFWNQATNRWTMFAHNMAPPAPGRTYQLWLISHGTKISAGTFTPSAVGDAMVAADYPLAPDALDAIAVTDEPSGGVPQPTGSMVLIGRQ
jgi:hypothetical protein